MSYLFPPPSSLSSYTQTLKLFLMREWNLAFPLTLFLPLCSGWHVTAVFVPCCYRSYWNCSFFLESVFLVCFVLIWDSVNISFFMGNVAQVFPPFFQNCDPSSATNSCRVESAWLCLKVDRLFNYGMPGKREGDPNPRGIYTAGCAFVCDRGAGNSYRSRKSWRVLATGSVL